MKNCPYCAEEIQDAAIFCRHCRRDLREPQTTIATKPKSSIWQRLGALALGYVVVAIAMAAVGMVAGRAFRANDLGLGEAINLALYVGYPAATFVGGFLAGRVDRIDAIWIGLLTGWLGAFFMWMDAGLNFNPAAVTTEDLVIVVLMIATGTIGGRLAK